MTHVLIRTAACAALLGGCASAPPPSRSLQTTAATIRAAEALGAGRTPKAAVHLQLAKEQAERARLLYEEGHRERAAFLLLRADADTEVAVALFRKEAAEAEAQRATAGTQTAAPATPVAEEVKP